MTEGGHRRENDWQIKFGVSQRWLGRKKIKQLKSWIRRNIVFSKVGMINILQVNKQILDEAEHDMKIYPDQGQCYLTKLKAEADNIDRGLDNS